MIKLFPKLKNKMLIVMAVLIALFAVMIIMSPGSLVLGLILEILAFVVVYFSQNLVAANMHRQLVNRLYNEMNVEGFLRDYEPMAKVELKNQHLILMVRLHLSNAYCALGRFDDAIAILDNLNVTQGKPEDQLLSRYAIVSNLCFCCQQKGDIEPARKHLDELISIRKQLEAMQQSKPEKKRMAFSTTLNEQCMQLLTSGSADIPLLKGIVQNSSQQLQRVTTSLWIARAMLAQNNRREAENILEQIVKLAPHLYPGKMAKKMLDELPSKNESK